MLTKPTNVANDPFRSAKWDELTKGRDFDESQAPNLALLCMWHQVIDRCIEDISINGDVQVAYSNDMGDLKALPQLSTMKQASAEIRQLNKQLGISENGGGEDSASSVGTDPLALLIGGATRAVG